MSLLKTDIEREFVAEFPIAELLREFVFEWFMVYMEELYIFEGGGGRAIVEVKGEEG